MTASGAISGNGRLVKMGDGTLDLSGVDNSGLLGGLTVLGGFVAADESTNLGSGGSALTFDGGGLQATASFTIPSGKEIDVYPGGAHSIATVIPWRSMPLSGPIPGPAHTLGNLGKIGRFAL